MVVPKSAIASLAASERSTGEAILKVTASMSLRSARGSSDTGPSPRRMLTWGRNWWKCDRPQRFDGGLKWLPAAHRMRLSGGGGKPTIQPILTGSESAALRCAAGWAWAATRGCTIMTTSPLNVRPSERQLTSRSGLLHSPLQGPYPLLNLGFDGLKVEARPTLHWWEVNKSLGVLGDLLLQEDE